MSESFWETETWAFTNSDNSGKSADESPAKKLPEPPNSNCPTPRAGEPEPSAAGGSKKRNKSENKTSGGVGSKQGGKKKGVESESGDYQTHIWTERERRKKMRSMFENLHALLPHLPPKADKSTIVDEAVSQIKTLEQTLEKLQKQKLERLHGVMGTISSDSSSLTLPRTRVPLNSREAFLADRVSANQSSINPVSQLPSPIQAFARFPTIFRTWISQNVILSVTGENAHINICCVKKLGLLYPICCILEKHNIEVITLQVSSDHYRSMYFIHARASGVFEQMSHEILSFEEIFQQAASDIMAFLTSLG